MDDQRLGAVIRVVRLKRGLRQADLARVAGVSHGTVSLVERGHSRSLSLDTIRKIGAALDVRVELVGWWRGGDLDRLLNRRHSLLAESVAEALGATPGWVVRQEVSFAIYRESGVVDLLMWHAETSHLIVIEIKTQLVDVNELLGTLDKKRRLAPQIVAGRGWRPAQVDVWLIVADTSTNRRHAREHATLLRVGHPLDGRHLGRILRHPSDSGSGVAFWSDSNPGSTKPGVRPPSGPKSGPEVCRGHRPSVGAAPLSGPKPRRTHND
jgi:transcriptional regulator with XRE-family HTH domain